jgi:hypothetical protein
VYAGYEYQGSADQIRMRPNWMYDAEINQRIADLFNLADPAYQPLSVIVHVFKLIRLAPKVSLTSVFCVDRIVDKNIYCNSCGPYDGRCTAWKGTHCTFPWRPGWTIQGAWSPLRGTCSSAMLTSMTTWRKKEHRELGQTPRAG